MTDEIFDVRSTLPSICKLEDPKISANMDTVNFMVFLLKDVKFRDLFNAQYVDTVRGLIPRVGETHTNGLISQDQHDALVGAGQELVDALADSTLTLKDLYTTPREQLPESLWEPTGRMVGAGLDLPFYNQPDEKKAEAQEVFDLGYLNDSEVSEGRPGVGDLTEWHFYNLKATDYLKVHWMIQRAKTAHIMRSTVTTRGITEGTTKANDLACVNGVECRDYPDLFCSLVDGKCSLASDPWPG